MIGGNSAEKDKIVGEQAGEIPKDFGMARELPPAAPREKAERVVLEERVGTGEYSREKGAPVYHGLATEQGYSQDGSRIQKVRYSHAAMIDMIIANPRVKQNELASAFGYTVPWVSRVMGSDAFQAALAVRKEEIVDPFLFATIEERIRGLAMQSLDVIAEKLATTQSADIALKALDISTKALGFGARDRTPNVQNNFVVQMPGKAATTAEWAEAYGAVQEEKGSGLKQAKIPEALEHLPMGSTIDRDPTVQPVMTKLAEED